MNAPRIRRGTMLRSRSSGHLATARGYHPRWPEYLLVEWEPCACHEVSDGVRCVRADQMEVRS